MAYKLEQQTIGVGAEKMSSLRQSMICQQVRGNRLGVMNNVLSTHGKTIKKVSEKMSYVQSIGIYEDTIIEKKSLFNYSTATLDMGIEIVFAPSFCTSLFCSNGEEDCNFWDDDDEKDDDDDGEKKLYLFVSHINPIRFRWSVFSQDYRISNYQKFNAVQMKKVGSIYKDLEKKLSIGEDLDNEKCPEDIISIHCSEGECCLSGNEYNVTKLFTHEKYAVNMDAKKFENQLTAAVHRLHLSLVKWDTLDTDGYGPIGISVGEDMHPHSILDHKFKVPKHLYPIKRIKTDGIYEISDQEASLIGYVNPSPSEYFSELPSNLITK